MTNYGEVLTDSEELVQRFHRAQRKQVRGCLEMPKAVGHVRQTDEGRYVA